MWILSRHTNYTKTQTVTSTASLERVSCSLTSKKARPLSLSRRNQTPAYITRFSYNVPRAHTISPCTHAHTRPRSSRQPGFHAVNASFIPSGGVVGVKKIIIQTARIGLIWVGWAVICCCWTVWMCCIPKKKKKKRGWFSARAGWHRWLAEIKAHARQQTTLLFCAVVSVFDRICHKKCRQRVFLEFYIFVSLW